MSFEPLNIRRTIVCLIGSTRFHDTFQRANFEETLAGKIVLTVAFAPGVAEHGETVGITVEEKRELDDLHMAKVRMADEVLVINPGGHIGESTARELALARELGKTIRFLEPERAPAAQGLDPESRRLIITMAEKQRRWREEGNPR